MTEPTPPQPGDADVRAAMERARTDTAIYLPAPERIISTTDDFSAAIVARNQAFLDRATLAAAVRDLTNKIDAIRDAWDADVQRRINGQAYSLARAEAAESLAARQAEEIERLTQLLNTPLNDDWIEGVKIEAAHQVERWGSAHDAGKEPPDWFWLLGWLAGKALTAASKGDAEKARHHTISSGAVLLNWWRHISGLANEMRPSIDPAERGVAALAPRADVEG